MTSALSSAFPWLDFILDPVRPRGIRRGRRSTCGATARKRIIARNSHLAVTRQKCTRAFIKFRTLQVRGGGAVRYRSSELPSATESTHLTRVDQPVHILDVEGVPGLGIRLREACIPSNSTLTRCRSTPASHYASQRLSPTMARVRPWSRVAPPMPMPPRPGGSHSTRDSAVVSCSVARWKSGTCGRRVVHAGG